MKKGFISSRLRSGKKSLDDSLGKKIQTIEAKRFTWVDMQNPDRTDVEELAKKYHFNALNIE
ncbi:MAG: magnesium transporter, partial [Candidatus Nitrosomaritimum yanchengensis]